MEILELKSLITEMKNSWVCLSELAEEAIKELKERSIKIMQWEEQTVIKMWDTKKHTNICISGDHEEEEREKSRNLLNI